MVVARAAVVLLSPPSAGWRASSAATPTWSTSSGGSLRLALEAGVDVAVVSKQLGHSSPMVTWTTYQHVRKGMQTDAAERVASAIFDRSGA